MNTDGLPLTMKVCNCAQCGRLLIGPQSENEFHAFFFAIKKPSYLPYVGRWINERPYCYDCLAVKMPRTGRYEGPDDEQTPWQHLAVRAWEDTDLL